MDYLKKIITDIELHSVEGIRDCFNNGISPNDTYNNEPLIYELTSEYTRSPRFTDCVKAFVDYGLSFDDKALLAVLMNNAEKLEEEIKLIPVSLAATRTLRCAYTPLHKVSLLHICAEFNQVSCAEVLVKHGADVNAAAGTDDHGFGGHTPIFHTVNQNTNQSADMLHFLLKHNARLDITVKGFIWGKGYPWETFIPSVNPISYAMMGLLPQMHRNEQDIAGIVSILLRHLYHINYQLPNIPNKYIR